MGKSRGEEQVSLLSRRIEDMKRVVSKYPMAGLKVDNLVLAVRAERDAEIIASLEANLERLVSDSFEWNGVAGDEYREFDPDRFKGRLLALIKGENK
jgi:hypothetical protein